MRLKSENGKGKILTIINIALLIIAIIIIYEMFHIYKINNFGEFIKAEHKNDESYFSRDDTVKYSNKYSYKIDSPNFNDALIYKNVTTEQNTVYKVTAMVKFQNVENEKESSEGGVNIGILDTTEKSDSLVGDGEWQKLSFQFDSKNRTSVDITFRLGSFDDNSKGTVWFSDFTIEKGKRNTDRNWNFICLIMKKLDVEIEKNGATTKTKMELEPSEISLIESNMKRFQTSMKEMSRRINDTYI